SNMARLAQADPACVAEQCEQHERTNEKGVSFQLWNTVHGMLGSVGYLLLARKADSSERATHSGIPRLQTPCGRWRGKLGRKCSVWHGGAVGLNLSALLDQPAWGLAQSYTVGHFPPA